MTGAPWSRAVSTLVRQCGRGIDGARRPDRCSLLRHRSSAPRLRRSGRGTAGCSRPRTSACSKARIATRGRSPKRSWMRSASRTDRWSPTSAPAAAGSRCGSRGASDQRHCLRGGRPAADARGDPAARRARRAEERAYRPRHADDPRLPRELDAALIVDAYHELTNRDRAGSRSSRAALKPRPARHRGLHQGRRRTGPPTDERVDERE